MNNPTLPPPLIGWPLLPQPDDDGRLLYPNLETSVRQAIRVILSTRPGEQLMHPTFGAGLSDFLNEPNTLTTRRRIRAQVTETLGFWEPRIVLERVDWVSIAAKRFKPANRHNNTTGGLICHAYSSTCH